MKIHLFTEQFYWELPSENRITGLEINPNGETVATIDCFGICLISDIDTNKYSYHMDMGNNDSGIFNFAPIARQTLILYLLDGCGRCR